jgi:hypothetical protein
MNYFLWVFTSIMFTLGIVAAMRDYHHSSHLAHQKTLDVLGYLVLWVQML